jgi:2,3,4,5-tetrahydropyridine-2,6-dicarboxylate N-succinyltransferase
MSATQFNIQTKDDFKRLTDDTNTLLGDRKPVGFGIARITRGKVNPDQVLMCNFLEPNWKQNYGSAAALLLAAGLVAPSTGFIDDRVGQKEIVLPVNTQLVANLQGIFTPFVPEAIGDAHQNVQAAMMFQKETDYSDNFRAVVLFEDDKPQSVEAAYLKLYALSARRALPNTLVTDGIFGALPNVAWVNGRPVELELLANNRMVNQFNGDHPNVDMQDKFPRMLDHVQAHPTVRILDSAKVRLGAYVAPGTVVMPGASYINFNAGTMPPRNPEDKPENMIEGRISAKVRVGNGSDLGGGASTVGTLSGLGDVIVSIGERTLLGANSVTGISIGDGCIVDGGATVLPGTPTYIPLDELEKIRAVNAHDPKISERLQSLTKIRGKGYRVKAYELMGTDGSGANGIHWRTNGDKGILTATRSKRQVVLNAALHA